jgi:hypothetical protein
VQFNGKHIRVDTATAPRKGGDNTGESGIEYDRTRSIFVGNLPFDVEVYLCSILELYATITENQRKASLLGKSACHALHYDQSGSSTF